ncbi:MAG: hypothetical protein KBF80_13460 [Flavobacteriales bacterium]|nr:hypothetical protein [Flavobacteriales bacterium]
MSSLSLRQQANDRRTGMLSTLLFHALLLLLFLYVGLKQPNPLPKEQAIELVFEDLGGAGGGGGEPTPATAAPATQEPVEPEPAYPVNTQEDSEVALPKPEKPKPKPAPPKTEQPPKPNPNALFTPSKPGSGTNKPGSTFSPGGSGGTGSGNGSGGGSGGGTGLFQGQGFQGQLAGRGLKRGPSITEKPDEGGRVALDIWVDRHGKVTHVAMNLDRSTTTSTQLFNLAKKAALQCTFSAKPDGPAEQKGEMTFIFELH